MNYEPVFLSIPDDLNTRWKLLREFIRSWHNIDLHFDGDNSEVVEEEEKKLGFMLPSSFREWISLASELIEKVRFNIFRDSYKVTSLDTLSATTLLLQSEGNYYWAVKNENLALEDPPVDGYWLDYRMNPERFIWFAKDAEHITSFAMEHLAYFLRGTGGGCSVKVTLDDEFLNEMKHSFDTYSRFDHLSIFEKPNIIAIIAPNIFEGGHSLIVEIWKSVAKSEIPECIYERIKGGGSFHGMLLSK